jgi:hypothetical protein
MSARCLMLALLLFQAACKTSTPQASDLLEGVRDGNTGELDFDQDNPWFLDEKPIEYCVMLAPDENDLTIQQAKDLVEAAIEKWRQFFQKYGLLDRTFEDGRFPRGASLRLNLDFRAVDACEDPSSQLIFAFGGNTVHTAGHEDGLRNDLGAALRGPYDFSSFHNGGTVWVAPFVLSRSLKLEHILLHELGHVFGMPHNSTWVMDAEIAETLRRTPQTFEYGKIESEWWPFRLRPGDELSLKADGFAGPAFERLLPGLAKAFKVSQSAGALVDVGTMLLKFDGLVEGGAAFTLSVEQPRKPAQVAHGVFAPTGTLAKTIVLDSGQFDQPFGAEFERIKIRLEEPSVVSEAQVFPSFGHFEINGVKLPAVLDLTNGIKVRIYSPDDGAWWTGTRCFSACR